jgi:hypothetical protein
LGLRFNSDSFLAFSPCIIATMAAMACSSVSNERTRGYDAPDQGPGQGAFSGDTVDRPARRGKEKIAIGAKGILKALRGAFVFLRFSKFRFSIWSSVQNAQTMGFCQIGKSLRRRTSWFCFAALIAVLLFQLFILCFAATLI